MRPSYLQSYQALWLAVATLLLLRLASLGFYPVMETTEARYAEIGRLMAELNDWVTPWYDYGEPFWAKPPASLWATALSINIFGVSEFSVRLPHWVASILIGVLVWVQTTRRSRQEAAYATALLAGSLLFTGSAGAVMTDMWLVLGTTAAMTGFWLSMSTHAAERRAGKWLLFPGLALGLLAKGPIAIVLCGLPLTIWVLWEGRLKSVWHNIPWIRGLLLTFALTAPWYILAEQRTPGFLQYFLVGEHWNRFIASGWQGDLYGKAHALPRGSIWIFLLIASLPWAILLPATAWLTRKTKPASSLESNDDRALWRYLLLWALAPCVFFSFSGNILATYVLPGMPALALLCAGWVSRNLQPATATRALLTGVGLTALMLIATLTTLELQGADDHKTAKGLVRDMRLHRQADEPLIYMSRNRPYSAGFYLQGPVVYEPDPLKLAEMVGKRHVFIATRINTAGRLPASLRQRLHLVGDYGPWRLFCTNLEPSHQNAPENQSSTPEQTGPIMQARGRGS